MKYKAKLEIEVEFKAEHIDQIHHNVWDSLTKVFSEMIFSNDKKIEKIHW